jgi:hypothetical protein
MKKPELSDRFSILIKDKLHAQDLNYEEMGNMLLDLAQDFYENGEPDPKDIEVRLVGENYGKETITNRVKDN